MKYDSLNVKEIFLSIQGEGARQGELSIFIRLSGCNMNCSFCDTDWSPGKDMSIKEIISEISRYKCTWIVWTGGEPTLQLTDEIIKQFPLKYLHAIETNGSNPVPDSIDYIACSPKVSNEILNKNFNYIDELRYAVDILTPEGLENVTKLRETKINDLPDAKHYYLSPVFVAKKKDKISPLNVLSCLGLIKENPIWKLSIQVHKLIDTQ